MLNCNATVFWFEKIFDAVDSNIITLETDDDY